jgi:hypothetical protein
MALRDFLRLIGLAPPLPDAPPSTAPEHAYRAIDELRFPAHVREKVDGYYPQAGARWDDVEIAVRDFLALCAVAPSSSLVVPSHLVFLALQQFAQDQFEYGPFCGKAYGQAPTLTPMYKPNGERLNNALVGLTWQLACRQANIDSDNSKDVPRLFDLDERLGIKNPWRFRPDEPDSQMLKQQEFERLSQGDQTWSRYLPRNFR